MTHGEEPGPETHQDSAVLTYLEGFLMHQVAGGQGATTTQSGPLEQRKNEDTGLAQPIHGSPNQTHSHCGASHHLRKARLLNSEAWKECEDLRRPPLPVNGQCEEHHGEQNGSPRDKGASTLLASLLQSFSSRLQNVNLPQQIIQDLRPPNTCHVLPAQEEKTESSCPRPASTHLKGFVSKSKIHNRSSLVPYQRRPSSQERFSESPKARHSSTPSPSSESISCAERLKAVAKMVNIRLSPASSPKPSVACSQLALLLSSEAHLQQYTREHALKANLSGRLASERLSAMATQQTPEEKEPSTSSQTHRLKLLHSQSYNSPQIPTKLRQSSSQNVVVRKEEGSTQAGFRVRERRPFERQNRTFQNSSSLLLQLLNSHNPSQRINGQGHLKDERERLGMLSFPLLSDSEQSNPDSSFTKDSSDAESSYSVCSPIDLSLKRTRLVETPLSTSSSPLLDGGKDPALFIPTWNPGSSPVKATMDQMEICSGIKPHHKVTLLQLLLDHKNDERGNKVRDDTELLQAIIPKDTSLNTSSVFTAVRCEDTKEPCGLMCRSPILLPLKQDSNSTASSRGPGASPPSQTVPLDLCKSKPTYDKPGRDVAFSASKFLQNLAHCGNSCSEIASSVKTPLPPIEPLSQQLKMNHPTALLNGHSAPIKKKNVMREETKTSPVLETIQQVSEIENLLERRTVLQLLLGNSHQRENVSSKPKPEHERSCSVEPQTVGGPAMDASIKTEPDEDCKTWDYDNVPKQWQNLFESKKSSSCFTNAGIKQEPRSPEANAADGLLCHLLKSQPMQTPLLHKSNKLKNNCDQEFDLHGPTIPKKRKFSMELDLHPRQELSGSAGISAGDIETKEPSLPSSPPPASARFPAHEPPETRSFNVLKQLLLSDNCLKEPSHSRPVFASSSHTVLNGNGIKRPCYDLQNAHQERRSPNTASFTHDGVQRQTSPHLPRQEPPRTRISHSTIKELRVINGDNQTDKIEPDSPIFTKTNPILYYMLQRSNAHLFKGRERPGDLEKLQTKVHKESFGDSQAFDH